MKYYTLLKKDGEQVLLHSGEAKDYIWIREQLNCGLIEFIPKDYYPDGVDGIIWGDEEARFDYRNNRNPFTKVLRDNITREWDCVGDLLLEQTERQYKKWKNIL